MRHALWLVLCLGRQVLSGQVMIDGIPTAEVSIEASARGDLNLEIGVWDLPDANLNQIRKSAFPCDWKVTGETPRRLSGTCKRLLESDGAFAQGTVALAPFVLALREAGVEHVRLAVEDPKGDLPGPPEGWKPASDDDERPRSSKYREYEFWSLTDDRLPPAVDFRIGKPFSAARISIAFGFTLFGPALLAFWLRRRGERRGTPEAAAVWVHWLLTGMWLYWISAISGSDLSDLAAHLRIDSPFLTFALGAILFAGAPMASAGACIAVLMRAPKSERDEGGGGLVLRSLMREATLMIPFAMFIVGSGMFSSDWKIAMLSLPGAFVAYRLLSAWTARKLFGGVEALSCGPLAEAASTIANRAGVTLRAVYIVGNRSPREANAFAAGDGVLALTRGLVEHLTRRELAAVVAHEVGHLKRKHVGMKMMAFWGYILVVGPVAANLVQRFHLPAWLLSLPLLPLAYILATAYFSRKHEFSADEQAAEYSADAEGMIAALARIRRLTSSPVDWGGIQGSVISHPSMRDRVLAIARRFDVPEERALELLADPDLLSADTPPELLHYPLPVDCSRPDLIFTSSFRHSYCMWSNWAGYVALAGFTLAAGALALLLPARFIKLGLLLGLPLAAWSYLAFVCWLDRCAMKYLRSRLRRRMGVAAEKGVFAGLIPGGQIDAVDGFYLWDAGFLFLSPDYLTFRGERAQFSVARSEVAGISVRKGPLSWDRDGAAVIQYAGGEFSLTLPDRGTSLFQARRLERRLSAWRRGEAIDTAAVEPAPAPDRSLLASRSNRLRGWRAIRYFGLRAFLVFIGITIMMPFSAMRWTSAVAFVPFLTPAAYLFAYLPWFLRRRPPQPAADSAPSREHEEEPVLASGSPVPEQAAGASTGFATLVI